MSYEKFKLLMWKNYRLRRYHWVMTLIEFLLPILTAYGLSKIAAVLTMGGNVPAIRNATYAPTYTKRDFLSRAENSLLVYTPSNDFTNKLMEQVKGAIDSTMGSYREKEKRDVDSDVPQYSKGLFRFLNAASPGKVRLEAAANETELEFVISNFNVTDPAQKSYQAFGIVFYDLKSDNEPPNILNYALRDPNKWFTAELYPLQASGPNHNDPYNLKGFAGLQVAINEAFTLLKTKQDPWTTKEVLFQPFPYPEYASDDSPRAMVTAVMNSIVIFVFLIISVPLIRDIIEEKDNGVKELMKLAGLEEWLVWVCWFVHAFIVTAISFTFVAIILKYPFDGEGSEGIHSVTFPVLWMTFIFYAIANIAFCFMFCAIFQRASVATSVFLLSFFAILFAIAKLNEMHISTITKLTLLFPASAFNAGFEKIKYFELQGIEFGWSSMTLTENNEDSVSLLFALVMLIFDAVLYFFLAYYITMINPGKFGAAKSPFFIFKSLFSKFKDENTQPLRNLDDKPESEFIESVPANLEATVQIKDLYKSFGFVNAVNGVNLNVYKGEITALLGHNGAGKTTTMSILTGLTSPTAGSIYYKNMDVFRNMIKFRENLGMCPQENRLFPYLTVMDHLLFFGMLKGISHQEATFEAEEYLRMMEMESKKYSLGKELSGGMKRKLCLSISLMGKADTLILDEPTSGMDVQSRRKIWDLLLEMRGNRTIILTTHYMEEADALGDRIAIMHHGSIVCHGTPIFLKKAYGTGYELTITKERQNTENITETIQDILPNANVEYETPEHVVFKLPLTETAKFPELFRDLETNKHELGIKQMGVACTTMEHVFLKVGGISIYDSNPPPKSTTVTDAARGSAFFKTTRGSSLIIQQVMALWNKKFLYTSRNLFAIFTRIVLPTALVLLLLYSLRALDFSPEPSLDLSLPTYPGSTVMVQNNDPNGALYELYSNYVKDRGGFIVNSDDTNILEGLLNYARKNLLGYNKNVLTAAEFSKDTTKVLYNLWETHSLPIAITTFSNVLLKSASNDPVEIQTHNHPVKRVSVGCDFIETAPIFYVIWFIALAFYTFDTLAYFAGFINMERLNGFKHIQIMSHVPVGVYWLGTLLFDLSFFVLIMTARISLFKMFDYFNLLEFAEPLGVLILMLIFMAVSGLLFVYCFSYISNSAEGSYTLFFIGNAISGIVVLVYHLFEQMVLATQVDLGFSFWTVVFYVTKYVILLTPPLNFGLLFIKFTRIWISNASCLYCPDSAKALCEATFSGLNKKSYLVYPSSKNTLGMLTGFEFLAFDVLLYALVLAFLNMGYVEYWWNNLKNKIYGTEKTTDDFGDSDVQKEYNKVLDLRRDAANSRQVSLLADGLRKNYIKWFRPFTAVADVNFVVQPGECFGLLGVNGAGKTTTFKMLTTDILPTIGDAAIEGIKMSENKMQYLSMAGYCAQTNCFIDELTGREMLTLIASLRGVVGSDIKMGVDKWIFILGLEEYQNQACGTYSGGNKRKLCTAMSLIGDPRVVFLDEPTSGVDPVSRRKLYDVMKQSKQSGQAVVLTSHSMEECESLCDRLTIMAAGVMKCIGTTQHLKKQYAQGFTALIKIRDVSEGDNELAKLKSDMVTVFTPMFCVLKDEHKGLLYYQIKDTNLPWSTLFSRMEGIKLRHQQIVEDYVLTDTTLEEVFISFAKSENNLD